MDVDGIIQLGLDKSIAEIDASWFESQGKHKE
jgi:hypothetical protein